MLEVVIPFDSPHHDYVVRHVGKLASDWEEADQDHEETVLCFYFDNERNKLQATMILETMERYGIRFGEH